MKSTQDTDNRILSPEQTGLLIAHYGNTLIVESQAGVLYRCHLRQNLSALVTGDNVIWQATDDKTGVVVGGLPRRSVMMKPDRRGVKPFVANVDQMIIMVAHTPSPHPTTLDRYIVFAESSHIHPLIVFNKIDLPTTKSMEELVEKLNYYQSLGYQVFKCSVKTLEGIEDLKSSLNKHTTIVAGQSGVGKSSLLNFLIPDSEIRTQMLSQKNKLGQQTTTATTLYHLPEGGDVIDSPGIHQFNLHHFTPKMIQAGFKEFLPYVGQCKFRNCEHKNDPGCAWVDAVRQGKVAPFRLENYHQLLTDKDQQF